MLVCQFCLYPSLAPASGNEPNVELKLSGTPSFHNLLGLWSSYSNTLTGIHGGEGCQKETASHLLTAPCQTHSSLIAQPSTTPQRAQCKSGETNKQKNHLMRISLQTERQELLVHWPWSLFRSCLHPYTIQAALNEEVDNRTS